VEPESAGTPTEAQKEFIREWDRTPPEDRHILVIDEFGNVGPSKEHETKFGFGVSDVKHPRIYAGLSRIHRRMHCTGEKKAAGTSLPGRTLMAACIRLTGTKTSCIYVDKGGDMPDFMKRVPRNRLRGMLSETLDETLPDNGAIWVVVDHNNCYCGNTPVKKICRSKSNGKRIVCGSQYESEGMGCPSDLIQTNDHVVNAARSNVELGKTLRSRILGIRFEQLKGGTRRRRPRGEGRRPPDSRLDRRRPRGEGRRPPDSRLDL
jgi:hypothetical protein